MLVLFNDLKFNFSPGQIFKQLFFLFQYTIFVPRLKFDIKSLKNWISKPITIIRTLRKGIQGRGSREGSIFQGRKQTPFIVINATQHLISFSGR